MDYLYMQPVTGCLFYKYTQFAMMGIILDLKGLNNLGDFCMLVSYEVRMHSGK